MSLWSLTKSEISERICSLVRKFTGSETVTQLDKKIISDAINAAVVDMATDYGIDSWRFLKGHYQVTVPASAGYADLQAGIFNIVSGTVRILEDKRTLFPASIEGAVNTEMITDTGYPLYYSIETGADADTLRLRLSPKPSQDTIVDFVAEKIADEDAINTVPAWMHATLKDKATANALRDLGLLAQAEEYDKAYEKRKQRAKASQGYDGPRTVNRVGEQVYIDNLQSRAN